MERSMPRPKNAVPSRYLHLMLMEEDAVRLDLHLWSEAEARIPHAARQKFFTRLMREHFGRKSLDLSLYFPSLGPQSFIYGPPALIEHLQLELEGRFLNEPK